MHEKQTPLFITTFCFSQKVTLSGSVKDSLQNSMSYANVIANSKDVSKNLQFAIIDNEGYYKEEIAQLFLNSNIK